MKFCQLRVMLVSVIVVIMTSCLSSTSAPWSKHDGVKFVVPRRMARLLKKITKQNLELVEESVNYGMQTSLKMMKLSGLRNRDEPAQLPASGKATTAENSGLIGRRERRSVKTNNLPATCHSGKVYVNLTKYTNIIAPRGFYTHYCGQTFLLPVGKDPIVQILSQAIMDAFTSVKKLSAKALANPLCCAPKKLHDIYILYSVGSSYSTIRSIPNIKAGRCVCKTGD